MADYLDSEEVVKKENIDLKNTQMQLHHRLNVL